MEKLKDFIYDTGDVVVSVAIVAVILITLYVKLNSSIPEVDLLGTNNSDSNTDTSRVASVTIDMQGSDTKVSVEEAETLKKPEIEVVEPAKEIEKEPEPKQEPKKIETTEMINISVPSGYTSQKIAQLLYENKIISNTSDFLDVVESEGVSTRLQSGNFKLSSSMSYKEIARKIAGM